ncbi:hypothetical protein NDU88_001180 [Pleurodeles waltl]|uniref:Metalloendopeptidase n=1 Tax=Pleurodeles waltl TaxID=8319 RepID=A0AAV7LWX1_PLEWA|nr:hypothetical protein NDU88_001180 [Pleurodeles waltl]
MRSLALAVLALCATGWAFPAKSHYLERTRRQERKLEDTAALESAFNLMYSANQNGQHAGSYFNMNLDVARREQRSARECSSGICTWPKHQDGHVYVPYMKTDVYSNSDHKVFLSTFKEYADRTCIRFVPRTSETDYIIFESLSGCWSPIGRLGNEQSISINKDICMVKGTVAHELMHSLGFHHEHVRKDRDNYVSVQWDNILTDYISAFQMTDTNNMKYTPYDYSSIMHYGKKAYSKDGISQTMVPIPDGSVNIGQMLALSEKDILKINLLYQCDKSLGIGSSAEPRTSAPYTMELPDGGTTTTTETLMPMSNITAGTSTASLDKSTNLGITKSIPTSITQLAATNVTPWSTKTARTNILMTNTTTITTTTTKTIISPTTTTSIPWTTSTTSPRTTTTTPRMTTTRTPPSLNACGGTVTARSGEITSPNYPEQYPKSTYCLWTIPATRMVTITFVDFELERSQRCMFDYLKFDDLAEFETYVSNSKYCGAIVPNTQITYGGSIQIIFVSDTSVQMKGFRLRYMAE